MTTMILQPFVGISTLQNVTEEVCTHDTPVAATFAETYDVQWGLRLHVCCEKCGNFGEDGVHDAGLLVSMPEDTLQPGLRHRCT